MWEAEDFTRCDIVQGFEAWRNAQQQGHEVPHKVYLAYELLYVVPNWGVLCTDEEYVKGELAYHLTKIESYLQGDSPTPPTFSMALLEAFMPENEKVRAALVLWENDSTPHLDDRGWTRMFSETASVKCFKKIAAASLESARLGNAATNESLMQYDQDYPSDTDSYEEYLQLEEERFFHECMDD